MGTKNKIKVIFVALALATIVSGYNACSQSYKIDSSLDDQAVDGLAVSDASPLPAVDSAPVVIDPVVVPPPMVTPIPDTSTPVVTEPPPVMPPALESITQSISIAANDKVDILIVDDNSGSMALEQASMASRFGSFLSKLNGLDWQLGITTTDVSADADKKDGRLLRFGQNSNLNLGDYLIGSSMDASLAEELFASTIQRPINEGSGREQGIFATHRVIERSLDAQNLDVNLPNRKLIRPDATLAVIVVTDADETPGSSGITDRNKPEFLLGLVKDKLGESKRFSFHSIIVKPNDEACKYDSSTVEINGRTYSNMNEGFGTKYADLSNATGGVIGSVCATDYSSQLGQIGNVVAESVKTATLNCLPQDTNNDGKPDVTAIDNAGDALEIESVSGLTLTFVTPLPIGSTHLSYACIKSVQ